MNIRRKKRYSHINIGLKVEINDAWKPIKALDWNEDGFNFYIDRDIDIDNVMFRKGVERFSGTIVWRRIINNDHVILEIILNRFLFEELGKIDLGSDNYRRIIKLIRTQGKQEEKEKLLIVLKGLSIVNDALSTLEKYKIEQSLYRYGVKVVSEEWVRIVRYVLKTSSVVQVLDNIEKELSRISDEIL
ncbi:MAG: hypothetical protein HZB30_07035 [Nitrospirae bacterium]|nr:hypothetical protein [Nitrospirota bacterium]